MSDINQLTAQDTIGPGDLFAIWSGSNGDTRRISFSSLVAAIQAQLDSVGGFVTQYAAPNATGFTVAVVPAVQGGSVWLELTPLAAYAAGTVLLPLAQLSMDGQEVLVTTTQTITALTNSGNGGLVNGAPTTLAANTFYKLRFDKVLNTWQRVG